MKQSKMHVAIIMDGNGRWAQSRGLPRSCGHAAGAGALRRVVESAVQHGIATLTLYAFSSDNWKRPPVEVSALMSLLVEHLRKEAERCCANGIRLKVIGRRDRLAPAVQRAITAAEDKTAFGRQMLLRLAVDYSARDAIFHAAQSAPTDREQFGSLLGTAGDVDLLIRTGGEQRLSDFLLWECAYAELYFTPTLWPDFGAAELARALQVFDQRDRRFGALASSAPQCEERWLS